MDTELTSALKRFVQADLTNHADRLILADVLEDARLVKEPGTLRRLDDWIAPIANARRESATLRLMRQGSWRWEGQKKKPREGRIKDLWVAIENIVDRKYLPPARTLAAWFIIRAMMQTLGLAHCRSNSTCRPDEHQDVFCLDLSGSEDALRPVAHPVDVVAQLNNLLTGSGSIESLPGKPRSEKLLDMVDDLERGAEVPLDPAGLQSLREHIQTQFGGRTET